MLRMVILALALAMGCGAAWMLYSGTNTVPAELVETPVAPPPVEILVASTPIAVGDVVSAENLSWNRVADGDPVSTGLRRSDRPDARTELIGRVARRAFAVGDAIMEAQLAEGGAGYLATLLNAGERAVAIQISAENTAGGFVLPGDRVDILYTGSAADTTIVQTHTILENLEVLAIDQTTVDSAAETDAFVGRTATLRVDRDQAERLTKAKTTGELSLTLRAYADAAVVAQTPVELVSPTPPPSIRIRRAGLVETVAVR